jgi:hypothetical protein
MLEIVCSTCPDHVVRIRYAGFYQFRAAASKCHGYDYEAMDLVACEKQHPLLFELIRHSDCTGTWTPDECDRLLPLMRQLAVHPSMQEHGPKVRCWRYLSNGVTTVTDIPAKKTFAAIAREIASLMNHCAKLRHVAVFR